MQLTPPLERVANVIYRRKVREWATKKAANRQYLFDRCRQDFHFFLKTFAYLYEPRGDSSKSPIIPFIPYPHQIPVIDKIIDHFGLDDIIVEKSRAQGCTYICMYVFVWRWLFFHKQNLGVVSRSLEAADSPRDPNSIGSKIDTSLKLLPEWMLGKKGIAWERNISRHTWTRNDNDSNISAYGATGDVARGGRATAMFMDELAAFPAGDDERAMASTFSVTDCRLIVSTYQGQTGSYYEIASGESSTIKLRLDWKDNPSENQGMFKLDPKTGLMFDFHTDKPYPDEDYEKLFQKEYLPALKRRGYSVADAHKAWSPWYVKQCLRGGMTPKIVSEELDINPEGSGSRFISPALIKHLMEQTQPPTFICEPEYTLDTLKITRLIPMEQGPLHLWLPMHDKKHWSPPRANYILGCDVAYGLGTSFSSNSCICILNRDTGVKVGEFASPTTIPERLAEIAIALCRFFKNEQGHPAHLGVEVNGPGNQFVDRVLNSDFRNLYYRSQYKSSRKKRAGRQVGFWSTKDAKVDLFSKYRFALQEGYFTEVSAQCLREAGGYIVGVGGKLEYSAPTGEDPSNAGEAHGDRATASAIANFCAEQLGYGAAGADVPIAKRISRHEPPAGSFGHRKQEWLRKNQKKRFEEW